MVILEAKKTFLSKIKPEMIKLKKRKLNLISGAEEGKHGFVQEFQHEHELKQYYDSSSSGKKRIIMSDMKKVKGDLYAFLNIKELCQMLDLKKEVILTMLH